MKRPFSPESWVENGRFFVELPGTDYELRIKASPVRHSYFLIRNSPGGYSVSLFVGVQLVIRQNADKHE